MTINQQQDLETGQPQQDGASAASTPAISPAGAARRRFTRAGLGASGVLMTLASQPGMAATVCTTPSGSLSSGMQTSHSPVTPPTCGGVSPGFYKNTLGAWPSAYPSTGGTLFGTLFPGSAPASKALRELTLLQVMQLNGDDSVTKQRKRPNTGVNTDPDPHNVGGHILAAYFNLLTSRSNVMTEAMIKSIWRDYDKTGAGVSGYYMPSGTVKWYGDKIVAYIKTTFHQVV